MATEKNNNNANGASANNNNGANVNTDAITAKNLVVVKHYVNNYKDSFKNACLVLLNAASAEVKPEDAEAAKNLRRLNAFLGLNADSLKKANVGEFRNNVLAKLPYFHTINENGTHFPARLKKVSGDQITAGMQAGYIAVKDTYLNALLSLGAIISRGNKYDCHKVTLTESAADEVAKMDCENTTCIVYDKNGENGADNTEKYIKYRQAKKQATDAIAAAKSAEYIKALNPNNAAGNTESAESEKE